MYRIFQAVTIHVDYFFDFVTNLHFEIFHFVTNT